MDADGLIDDVTRWLADARVDEAVAARARERWMAQAASEDATWVGLLQSLAETRAEVTLHLDGRRLVGEVLGVGLDVVVVTTDQTLTLVALSCLHGVAAAGRRRPPARAAVAPTGRLIDILAGLAGEERWCRVTTGREQLTGRLTGCGTDVVTLSLDSGRSVYLRTGSISEVSMPR